MRNRTQLRRQAPNRAPAGPGVVRTSTFGWLALGCLLPLTASLTSAKSTKPKPREPPLLEVARRQNVTLPIWLQRPSIASMLTKERGSLSMNKVRDRSCATDCGGVDAITQSTRIDRSSIILAASAVLATVAWPGQANSTNPYPSLSEVARLRTTKAR